MPYIVGPANDVEAKHWDELEARAAEADAAITEQLVELKKKAMRKYEQFIFDDIVYEHRIRVALRHAAPSPETRRTLRYQRPTANEMLAHSQMTKQRYRLFAKLTDGERRAFIREAERYGAGPRIWSA